MLQSHFLISTRASNPSFSFSALLPLFSPPSHHARPEAGRPQGGRPLRQDHGAHHQAGVRPVRRVLRPGEFGATIFFLFFFSFRNASLVQCWTTTARGGGSRPSFSTRCYPETAFKPPRTIRARSSLRPERDKRGTRAPPNAPFRSRRFLLTSPPAIDNRKKTLSPPLSLSSTTGSRRPEGRHGRLQGRHHDRAR